MDKLRLTPAVMLVVCAMTVIATAEDAPDFNAMVGTKLSAPRPAPASTFQRAAEDGRPIPEGVLQRAEQPAYVPQEALQGSVPPSIEPASVKMRLTKQQAQDFVRDYLAAAQQDSPEDELALYSDSVDYFNRGPVGKKHVARDQSNYYRRWPSRAFTLLGEPKVISLTDNRAVVRYRLQYQLGDGYRIVQGETVNTMVIEQSDAGRRIVALKESRY